MAKNIELEQKFKEYLDQLEVVKTLNADLRDATKSHELNNQIENLTKELKQLKEKLAATSEIGIIKENRDGAKERLDLLRDILLAEMNEAGESEVVYNGKKAKVVPSVKFEKQ